MSRWKYLSAAVLVAAIIAVVVVLYFSNAPRGTAGDNREQKAVLEQPLGEGESVSTRFNLGSPGSHPLGEDQPSGNARESRTPELNEIRDRASKLMGVGRYQEALNELLDGYRAIRSDRSRGSIAKMQVLMHAIGRLAHKYENATYALRDLQRDALDDFYRHPEGRDGPLEIATLNRVLGDDAKTITLYDSLPAGDTRKRGLALVAYSAFAENQRYSEAAAAKPYGSMIQALDAGIKAFAADMSPADRSALHAKIVSDTAMNIEVLAGAGHVDDALELARRLFIFDDAKSTEETVAKHLERAKAASTGFSVSASNPPAPDPKPGHHTANP
ncbi:MAG TPA: hypothetical protein VIM71_03485 [Lacunisphaera sp.]